MSSCVVYTSAAGGRASLALLNAAGGNLLGVFISPVLLGLLTGLAGGVGADTVRRSVLGLCLMVLLPFVAGQALSGCFPAVKAPVKRVQSYVGQVCILTVMFCAFATSLEDVIASLGDMWACILYLVGLHLVIVVLVAAGGRMLRFPPAIAAAVVFCATQKTLALGLPLADTFFEDTGTPLALVTIPLIFYHLLQLTFGGFLVSHWSARIERTGPTPGEA
jgi:sodium/bile acid cotransporter 7